MRLPEVGDMIGSDQALALCQHYRLEQTASQIRDNPGQFKDWKFDGASMLPDKLAAAILRLDQEKFTEAALKHDLKYAYGISGDKSSKKRADKEFERDLIELNMQPATAKLFYMMVHHGGREEWKTSYSWGFARV